MKKYLSKLTNIFVYFKSLFYKRDENVWIFTEWFGNRCGDNSTYLANYVAENYNNLKLYWLCDKNADTSMLNSKIKILHKNSEASKCVLTKAAVFIMNQGLDEFGENDFSGGALIVNLWHGVMWKKLGMDAIPEKDILRAFYHRIARSMQSIIYECPSEEYKKNLSSAFGVKENNYIIAGQPRNSIFFSKEKLSDSKIIILKKLVAKNNKIDKNTRIITYMPTFRDNSDFIFDFNEMEKIELLNKVLEKYNAVIVQKAHFASKNKGGKLGCMRSERIIDGNDTVSQLLLAASDILITDYSSCFFDFLLLDRPIVHYLYDYDYYANKDRGLYYSYDEVNCGDVAFDEEQLLNSIQNALEYPEKDSILRKERRDKFQTYESADSCKVITNEIMRRLYAR